MNKIHQRKIKKFLHKMEIDKLAKSTQFYKRKPKKIEAFNFLLSFYLVLLKKNYSLRAWATELSRLTQQVISFQAIAKKLQIRQLSFVKKLFSKALEEYFRNNKYFSKNPLFTRFNRVLIEDSTCIKLVKALNEHYPGAKNQHKQSSTCRVQFCFDIKSNGIENVELTSFVKNDLTYADNILQRLKLNDLIIRDLGYIVTKVLRQIIDSGAFFISRFKIGIYIYNVNTGQQINLVKKLKRLDALKIKRMDTIVKLGAKEKVKVRIIALKLNSQQSKKRREHCRRNRSPKFKISKDAMYLMSWNILITNIEEEELTGEQIYELYSLRWHIEIIFKNWKSNFEIDQLIRSTRGPNPVKPELLLYLCLSFMILIYIPKLNYYHKIIFEKHNCHLSPYKFAAFVINHLEFIFDDNQEYTIKLLLQFCCYDKRKDRKNIYEKVYGMTAA